MNFLTGLSSYLPFINFTRASSDSRPIFQKYSSSTVIQNIFERQANLRISDKLPCYTLNNAQLNYHEFGLSLHYTDSKREQWTLLFKDEDELNQWIQDKGMGIWEIEDRRETPTILYKVAKEEEKGVHVFRSENELFTRINEEAGNLWKIVNSRDNTIVYMCAKRHPWTNSLSFSPKNLEELARIVETDVQNSIHHLMVKRDSQKSIFEKYSSSSEIANPAEKAANLFISGQLPHYKVRKAQLDKSENGPLVFNFQYDQTRSFESEFELDAWLQKNASCRIIEIEDFRKERALPFVYKLCSNESVETFETEQHLFEEISRGLGRIWKLSSFENPNKTLYILAKKKFCSTEHEFCSRNLEDLIYIRLPKNIITPEDLNPLPKSTTRPGSLAGLSIALLSLFAISNPTTKITSVASSASAVALRNGIAAGSALLPIALGATLFQSIAGTTATPTILGPNPLQLSVYSGESINFNISSLFNSSQTLGYTATLPGFLNYNSIPSSYIKIFYTADGRAGLKLVGNILYAFGGYRGGNQILDVSKNPPDLSGNSQSTQYLSGAVNQSMIYLAGGNRALQTFQVGTPPFYTINFTYQTPAPRQNVTVLGLETDRPFLWHDSNNFLNATDVSNPTALATVGSLNMAQAIAGIALGDNRKVHVISGSTLSIINGTSPSNLSVLGSVSLPAIAKSIYYRNNVCFVTLGSSGLCAYDVSGTAPVLMSSVPATGNGSFDFIGANGPLFVSRGDQPIVELFDGSDPANIKYLMSVPIFKPPYAAISQGNRLYVPTGNDSYVDPSGVQVIDVNQDSISGTPNSSHRGEHDFNITANDFNGGIAVLPVKITVLNHPPVVAQPIPPLTGVVGTPLAVDLSQTFYDADDGSNLTISTDLPFGYYNVTARELQGMPNATGSFNFTVSALDPYGGNVNALGQVKISMQATNPTQGQAPAASEGLGAGAIAGIIVGSSAAILLMVGGTYFLLKKRKKSEPNEFKLDAIESNKKINETFGGGAYGSLVWSSEEIKACYQDTGLKVDETGSLGGGAYGKVFVCWDIKNNCYAAMKVVNDPDKFEASKREAELQKDASGPGVWPVYNYSQDDQKNILRIFMPVAGLKDMNFVSKRVSETNNEAQRELYATYLAADILRGLLTLKSKKTRHFDMKGENVLVSKNGEAGISDFGCGLRTKEEELDSVRSDRNYKSPEQTDTAKIRVDKEDIWGAGITILEFLVRRPAISFVGFEDYERSSTSFAKHMENVLASFEELQSARPGSIWYVVKMLLNTDASKRWTPSEALKSTCFKNLDALAKDSLFSALIPEFNSRTTIVDEKVEPLNENTYMVSRGRRDDQVKSESSSSTLSTDDPQQGSTPPKRVVVGPPQPSTGPIYQVSVEKNLPEPSSPPPAYYNPELFIPKKESKPVVQVSEYQISMAPRKKTEPAPYYSHFESPNK
jgi:serine/threonine protein kinase